MFLLIQTILNHSRQKQGVKFPPPAFCQLRPMLFSSPPSNIQNRCQSGKANTPLLAGQSKHTAACRHPPSNIQKPLPVGDVSISPTDSGFACIYFSYK